MNAGLDELVLAFRYVFGVLLSVRGGVLCIIMCDHDLLQVLDSQQMLLFNSNPCAVSLRI